MSRLSFKGYSLNSFMNETKSNRNLRIVKCQTLCYAAKLYAIRAKLKKWRGREGSAPGNVERKSRKCSWRLEPRTDAIATPKLGEDTLMRYSARRDRRVFRAHSLWVALLPNVMRSRSEHKFAEIDSGAPWTLLWYLLFSYFPFFFVWQCYWHAHYIRLTWVRGIARIAHCSG